jgi:hypothetical protein
VFVNNSVMHISIEGHADLRGKPSDLSKVSRVTSIAIIVYRG